MGNQDEISLGGAVGAAVICVIGLVVLIAVLAVLIAGWTIVPAGAVGVQDTMGNVDNKVLGSGFHLKNPLTGVIMYDTKTQKFEADDIIANTAERLEVAVHVTVNYHIDYSKASEIYKSIGADYREKVLYPDIRSAIYEQVGKYKADELYVDRNVISGPAMEKINADMAARGIYIENVLIRGLPMPDTLKQSIEEKLQMEQNIQKKKNEVQVAEAEADRKRAEAQGIADANEIIARKLTKEYLEWYWMEQVAGKDNTIYVPMNGIMPVVNV